MWTIITAGLALWLATSEIQPIRVSRGQVGSVQLGSPAQKIYELFRGRCRLVDLGLEGFLTPALELTLDGATTPGGVVAELVPKGNELIVSRISVTDPVMRTDKGIGVGSSFAQLRSAHPVDRLAFGEGRLFARVEALGASFELNLTELGPTVRSAALQTNAIPPDTRIISVLLTR